jgi:hypothetical protein
LKVKDSTRQNNITMATAIPDNKGQSVTVCQNTTQNALLDIAIDCREANCLAVEVLVNGAGASADISIEGSTSEGGNYLPLPDINAIQTAVAANVVFDVAVGTLWAKVRIANIVGTFGIGSGFTITVTPSLSAGNTRLVATILATWNPMTLLGDLIYGAAAGLATRLAGSTSTARKFLRQTGTGSASAAPAWDTLQAGDIPGHHTTHENGGSDTISVAGLTGLLATAQTPVAHASTHEQGAGDAVSSLPTSDQKAALAGTSGTPSVTNKYVTDADSRNTNSRAPSAHHTTHESGGADVLAVMTGDAGTGGNVGYVPAPGAGDAAAGKYLKADGTFAVPPVTGITVLTGDVTATGPGSVAATIAAKAVTLAKMADMATASFLGRNTAAVGVPEVLSEATVKTMLGLSGTVGGNVPASSAAGDFLTGDSTTGNWLKSTLSGVKTLLGLGSAAYTSSGAYDVAGAAAAVTPATLALVIGTNTQAHGAKLDAIQALASAAGWLHNDGAGAFVYSTPVATIPPAIAAGGLIHSYGTFR